MPNTISPELFAHLVQLAALELAPAEAEYLLQQLNKQLKSIDELAGIQVAADLPAAEHGVPYPPHLRQPIRLDEWQPWPEPQTILEQAPETDAGYLVVPEIPHTDLD